MLFKAVRIKKKSNLLIKITWRSFEDHTKDQWHSLKSHKGAVWELNWWQISRDFGAGGSSVYGDLIGWKEWDETREYGGSVCGGKITHSTFWRQTVWVLAMFVQDDGGFLIFITKIFYFLSLLPRIFVTGRTTEKEIPENHAKNRGSAIYSPCWGRKEIVIIKNPTIARSRTQFALKIPRKGIPNATEIRSFSVEVKNWKLAK